jgi:hypothetical protein
VCFSSSLLHSLLRWKCLHWWCRWHFDSPRIREGSKKAPVICLQNAGFWWNLSCLVVYTVLSCYNTCSVETCSVGEMEPDGGSSDEFYSDVRNVYFLQLLSWQLRSTIFLGVFLCWRSGPVFNEWGTFGHAGLIYLNGQIVGCRVYYLIWFSGRWLMNLRSCDAWSSVFSGHLSGLMGKHKSVMLLDVNKWIK